jgi:hypothetical protein
LCISLNFLKRIKASTTSRLTLHLFGGTDTWTDFSCSQSSFCASSADGRALGSVTKRLETNCFAFGVTFRQTHSGSN